MFCGLGLNLLCFPPHSKKVSFDCWFHSSIFVVCLLRNRRERERDSVVNELEKGMRGELTGLGIKMASGTKLSFYDEIGRFYNVLDFVGYHHKPQGGLWNLPKIKIRNL